MSEFNILVSDKVLRMAFDLVIKSKKVFDCNDFIEVIKENESSIDRATLRYFHKEVSRYLIDDSNFRKGFTFPHPHTKETWRQLCLWLNDRLEVKD